MPEAEYYNKWWCMCENDDGQTHHRPEGGERGLCFPSDPEVQFVPMIRDGERLTQDNQTLQALQIPPQYQVRVTTFHACLRYDSLSDCFELQTVLGYNEPNMAEQADTSPLEAALAWMELQGRYEDRELVSPATAHADTEWMDQFMVECEILGCRIDYIATHFYKADSAENTINVSQSVSFSCTNQY